MEQKRKERDAVAALLKLGGLVLYDYQFDSSGRQISSGEPTGPAWLRHLFGENFFTEVKVVGLRLTKATDIDLDNLKGMTRLQRLGLSATAISDAGLVRLEELTDLQSLSLGLYGGESNVTDAGLEHIKGLTKATETLFGANQGHRHWIGESQRADRTPNAPPRSNQNLRCRPGASQGARLNSKNCFCRKCASRMLDSKI